MVNQKFYQLGTAPSVIRELFAYGLEQAQVVGPENVSFNEAFQDIIQTCGELRIEQEGAWLGTKMMEAYTHLHEQGFAASVEVWEEEQLVGGLYGVTLGRCFF